MWKLLSPYDKAEGLVLLIASPITMFSKSTYGNCDTDSYMDWRYVFDSVLFRSIYTSAGIRFIDSPKV